MNIGNFSEVINLVKQWTDVKHSTHPACAMPLEKPKFTPCDAEALEWATPESQGVSSSLILDYVKELREDKTIEIQNIMIVRNSKKIYEVSFDDHNIKLWKQTFSASKSIVSIAVGFAVREGLFEIDTPISEIFQDEMTALNKRTMKDVTVRDLLTMRSGVVFAEAECAVTPSWKKGYLSSSLRSAPGKTFNYNSLNTYMLAAAVVKKAGVSLTEYLRERLFEPLGIKNVYWEKSPEGIEKGGWGLYITPEDMAKIGVCALDGGMWKGREVIPAEYLRLATFAKCETPENAGRFDYGYQIWCGRDSDTFLFNGMFGQNMLAVRRHNIILISNCANPEVFQNSSFYSTTLKYFSDLSDERISCEALNEDPEAASRLAAYGKSERIGDGRKDAPLPSECSCLDGKMLVPTADSALSLGIMPLALQIVTGNYTKGTDSVSFEIKDGKFYVVYRENDAVHRFPVGFSSPRQVNMKFGGDVYRVAVSGSFAKNEDSVPVLKLRLSFAETPFVRTIKIFFDRGEYLFVFDETPTGRFVLDNVIDIRDSLEEYAILRGTLGKIDDDYIAYKIKRTFHPEIIMKEINVGK